MYLSHHKYLSHGENTSPAANNKNKISEFLFVKYSEHDAKHPVFGYLDSIG